MLSSPTPPAFSRPPLVVLVDDTRTFRDRRPHVQVRRGDDAVALAAAIGEVRVDELWLDYDLLDGTTVEPLVDHLVERAAQGRRLRVGVVKVHSARVPEGLDVTRRLRAAGYPAQRNYSQGIWTRFDRTLHPEWRPGDVVGATAPTRDHAAEVGA